MMIFSLKKVIFICTGVTAVAVPSITIPLVMMKKSTDNQKKTTASSNKTATPKTSSQETQPTQALALELTDISSIINDANTKVLIEKRGDVFGSNHQRALYNPEKNILIRVILQNTKFKEYISKDKIRFLEKYRDDRRPIVKKTKDDFDWQFQMLFSGWISKYNSNEKTKQQYFDSYITLQSDEIDAIKNTFKKDDDFINSKKGKVKVYYVHAYNTEKHVSPWASSDKNDYKYSKAILDFSMDDSIDDILNKINTLINNRYKEFLKLTLSQKNFIKIILNDLITKAKALPA